jgi:hypothetical protein
MMQVLSPMNEITNKEKLSILLSEYSSLRSELLSRTGYGFQIGAAIIALLTWLLQQSFDMRTILAFVLIACGVIIYTKVNITQMVKLSKRLRDIEYEVNTIAGEHIMIWEQTSGAGRKGYLAGALGHNPSLTKESLPELPTRIKA